MNFADPAVITKWIQVVLADLVLAGDNAVVIALAIRHLRAREQFWGRVFGTAGAVLLRVGFIAIVTYLLRIPLLQVVGGTALIWIAVKLLRAEPEQPTLDAEAGKIPDEIPSLTDPTVNTKGREPKVIPGQTLKDAVRIIIVADVIMSLDNVIAIAGVAKNNLTLAVFGLALSIPLVVWGSGLISKLMTKLPWLVWLAGGMLGYVAAHMLLADDWVISWLGGVVSPTFQYLERTVPWLFFIALTVMGWKWSDRTRIVEPA
jgi:YjbE family integral membrane protein